MELLSSGRAWDLAPSAPRCWCDSGGQEGESSDSQIVSVHRFTWGCVENIHPIFSLHPGDSESVGLWVGLGTCI